MAETSLKDRLLLSTLPADERENGRRLLSALSLIEGKLKQVEAELASRTASPIPTVGEIGGYLMDGGGKRIRPALLLLGARLLGYDGPLDVQYGACIELLHTATLVHDDIIDQAETRRGRPSVNRRWGNELTVLFGDYLYMKSMEVSLQHGDIRILQLLCDVTLAMTEGEILGTERRGSVDLSLVDYLEIVRRKTALLFAAACRIPTYLVEAPPAVGDTLWEFGLSLGVAFQLQDDLLDYTASEAELGKPVLSDLREGKLTLPMILALPKATRAERKAVEAVVRDGNFASVPPEGLMEIVVRTGALAEARATAEEWAARARTAVLSLPAGEARDGLLLAAEYAASRRK